MKRIPRVCVIVLNYNGIEDTRILLTSLLKTNYKNYEVKVVDNGSLTNQAKILAQEFKDKRVQFVRNRKNWGFAEGNNRIIRKSKARYVVLLNNDTKVDPMWLDWLVKVAESDRSIAACQPKILSLYKPEYFDYAGAAGGFIDKLGYPYARGRIGFHMEKDEGQYDNQTDIFWGSGTCLLLRRSLLKGRLLLPKDFFFYHEETDLCWKLKNLGYRIVFVPESVVYHKGGASSFSILEKRIFWVHRNSLLLIARNRPLSKLLVVLPIRMILDLFAMFFYLFLKRPRLIWSVLKADLSFLFTFPKILKERKVEKSENLLEKELKPACILWDYFVRRKKTFSEIIEDRKTGISTIYYEDLLLRNSNSKVKTGFNFLALCNGEKLLLFVISVFLIISWFNSNSFLGTGEEGLSLLRPHKTLILYGQNFQEIGTGISLPIVLQRITFFGIATLFDSLFTNLQAQVLIFLLLVITGSFGFFFLSNEFTGNKNISLLGSLFYLLNLYSHSQVWSRFLYSGMTAWAYFPLFLFLFIKWMRSKRVTWLFVFLITSVIFSNSFGHPAFIFSIWIPSFIYFLVVIFNKKSDLKKGASYFTRFLIALFLFYVFNLRWLYPNLKVGSTSFSEISGWRSNFDSLRGISAGIKFWDVPTLWHGLFLGKEGPWGWFYQNPLVLNFLRFLPLFVVILGIINGRKEKYFVFLFSTLLIGWFVSKGTNPPFGYTFFKFLFFNFPFTAVLRNPWEKFGLVFVLPYSIFFALGVNSIYQRLKPKVRQLAVGGILFLSCGVLVWPMWTGDVYTKDVHVQVPSFYEEANNFINSFGKGGRILMLPMIAGDGVKMTWGYGGIEPSEFLFDKPAISRILRTKYFDDIYWGLRKKINEDRKIESQDLKDLDVAFLILRKDLVQGLDKNDLNVDEVREIVLANKDIKHLKDLGDLEIYSFEPNKDGSLFEVLDGNGVKVSYQKFSPTRYKLDIKDSTEPFTLVFKNTYSDFWIARIGKEEIKDHLLVYNYANAWRIEKKGDYTIDIVFKVWPWE